MKGCRLDYGCEDRSVPLIYLANNSEQIEVPRNEIALDTSMVVRVIPGGSVEW